MWAPNIFSPDQDGLNDLFLIRGPIHPDNFLLIIYSRWGEKVFEATDPNIGWDGSKNNKKFNSGVFAYIAKGTVWSGQEFELSGNITLLAK